MLNLVPTVLSVAVLLLLVFMPKWSAPWRGTGGAFSLWDVLRRQYSQRTCWMIITVLYLLIAGLFIKLRF